MYRILFFFLMTFASITFSMAQMSDSQVIQYIKDGKKSGKSEKQLGLELQARGVTREQGERIKKNYEEGKLNDGSTIDQSVEGQQRERLHDSADDLTEGSLDLIATEVADPDKKHRFGSNIFRSRGLSFEPNYNMATPESYQLGPGDEVVINVWGANETTIRQVISPEGDIQVNNIGPVYLSGMTVKEANAYVQRELGKIYSGINATDAVSQIRLTLGKIRSIQVNVMGEVAVPGTYTLSSFATVFHALYRAGGTNAIGSLRNVMLMRNNRRVATVDIYDLILRGDFSGDIRLMEGDFIIVPPYETLVTITGKVKREMDYEMKEGETLSTLLKYAGGFTGDAYSDAIRVVRKTGPEFRIFIVDRPDFSTFKVEDGDAVSIGSTLDRYENRVEVRGAVFRDGMYELDGSTNTVKQLIAKASGLKGDAFLNRAQLFREYEDLTVEIIPVDLKALMDNAIPDIPLMRNDVLVISSIYEIQDRGSLTISGEVARPGEYPFAEQTTLEDLILQAGGLLEAASTVQIDVARRIKDPKSKEPATLLSETYTFALKDGLVVDGTPGFVLQPYDDVVVRRSPGYQIQRRVTVSGEVLFEGGYALKKKNERLSDLVNRAGGLTPDAYPKGARLLRKLSEEERTVRAATLQLAMQNLGSDSIAASTLKVSDTYAVGIDLDKALANPGSDYDVVVVEGDKLVIPEFISTVRISGVVMYPNTVFFKKGEKLSYYVNQAGGYGHRAKKSKAYAVYMNGTVSKIKNYDSHAIQPGCEIIIPSKKERKGFDISTLMSITSATGSLATMAAAIVALTKK
ncbi:SLBB domain-containing protein [Bacteroides sp. 519]|uniref:SLBB domain-containing protein n=1 Tax=Bacteroides sp. 519 TaxID=2302937 RepID=UPI0013CFC8B1|nr:SLBB domain-containing protein [Bacteroides sp. 519]NDV57826.1 capsule biosynthesis protein [Bacteroides sp. 519]